MCSQGFMDGGCLRRIWLPCQAHDQCPCCRQLSIPKRRCVRFKATWWRLMFVNSVTEEEKLIVKLSGTRWWRGGKQREKRWPMQIDGLSQPMAQLSHLQHLIVPPPHTPHPHPCHLCIHLTHTAPELSRFLFTCSSLSSRPSLLHCEYETYIYIYHYEALLQ